MIDKISDVTVKIDIQHPQPIVGLGNPAIFVKGTMASYKEYNSLEVLKKDLGVATSAYLKAKAIWDQENKPKTIAIVTFVEDKIVEAASNYFYNDWHFALLADYVEADALALSNIIEENKFKFLVLQVATIAELSMFEGNALSIGLVHPTSEMLDGALVGNTGSLPVGSVTWKFRRNLVGITPNLLTFTELEAINKANGIAYVIKAGIPQTSEGKTIGGEYIDSLHGDHWVKSNIETRIQRLLSTTDKLTFDSNGIALLNSSVSNVLEEAFSNGIIDVIDETGAGNYSVKTLKREDLAAEDIASRNYKGLSFSYKRSNAVHTVDVFGTIEA